MKKWIIWSLSALTLAIVICPVAFGEQVGAGNNPSVIRNIGIESDGSVDLVTIHVNGNIPEINPFTLTLPDRIVVDLTGCILPKGTIPPGAGDGIVKAIRVGQHPGKIRLVLDVETLAGVDYDTTKEEGLVTVHVRATGKRVQKTVQPPALSPLAETTLTDAPADSEAGPREGIEAADQTTDASDTQSIADGPDTEYSEEGITDSEDIWGEDTDVFPGEDTNDLWGEAPPSEDDNTRASDLWDQEPSDMAGAESAKDLWNSADSSPGVDNTPSPFELSG
jgi:hypothetical protein